VRIGAHQKGGQLRIKDAHKAAEAQELRLHAPAVCVEVGLQSSKHTVNHISREDPGSYLLLSDHILRRMPSSCHKTNVALVSRCGHAIR